MVVALWCSNPPTRTGNDDEERIEGGGLRTRWADADRKPAKISLGKQAIRL
jgi:hypothetical protein